MSIAFIIPLHPKHFCYANELIKKLINFDVYFVYSSVSDKNTFLSEWAISTNNITHIIIDINDIKQKAFATYKKWAALRYVMFQATHDYYIVCDAETDFVVTNLNVPNMLRKINQIYDNKLVYAGSSKSLMHRKIMKTASEMFKDKTLSTKLREITENYTTYTWWSDLPVYKRAHLKDFFSKIKFYDLNWFVFDHLVYQYYLILFCDFKIIRVNDDAQWSLEMYYTNDIKDLQWLKSMGYGFSWICNELYLKHKQWFDQNGTVVLYHLDRSTHRVHHYIFYVTFIVLLLYILFKK